MSLAVIENKEKKKLSDFENVVKVITETYKALPTGSETKTYFLGDLLNKLKQYYTASSSMSNGKEYGDGEEKKIKALIDNGSSSRAVTLAKITAALGYIDKVLTLKKPSDPLRKKDALVPLEKTIVSLQELLTDKDTTTIAGKRKRLEEFGEILRDMNSEYTTLVASSHEDNTGMTPREMFLAQLKQIPITYKDNIPSANTWKTKAKIAKTETVLALISGLENRK